MGDKPAKDLLRPDRTRNNLSAVDTSSVGNASFLAANPERAEFLANILEYSSQPFSLVTPTGEILDCNQAFLSMVGYTKEEIRTINWDRDLTPPEWHPVQNQNLGQLQQTGIPVRYEKEYLTKDGRRIAVELLVHQFIDRDKGHCHYYSFITDISQRKEAEEALRRSESKYRGVFENTPLGILHFDECGVITAYNESLAKIANSPKKDDLIGFNLLRLSEKKSRECVRQSLRGQKSYFQGDLTDMSGQIIPIEAQIAPVISKDGVPLGGVVIVSDINERKQYEKTIRHMAYHDALTGLPNRLLINDRISVALPQAKRQKQMLALVYLDLDDFKIVNDTLGHPVGDQLLLAVSERLKSLVREGDTIARMGGDEFLFLFPGLSKRQDAQVIATKILQSFVRPYRVDGHQIHVTASIGISVFPDDGQDAETLIKNADSALHQAKEQGGHGYVVFTPSMNEVFLERLTLANELRQALEHQELVLHYQPIIDMRSGHIVSIEALVRWLHPKKGLLMPRKFIPTAEETGLIIPLEKWVLRTVCRQNKWWQDKGLAAVRVAVNISGRHFWQQNLLETIAEVLEETGLEPRFLELEVTESVALRSIERVSKVLQDLRNRGLTIALDDFGTGYSSLSYLRILPLDSIKIDQSFIHDLEKGGAGLAIPRAVISLAKLFDIRVTAEGVENTEQLARLYDLQCDQIQGYLVCRPQPASLISYWLAQTKGVVNLAGLDLQHPCR